jgi:hypothetical protein
MSKLAKFHNSIGKRVVANHYREGILTKYYGALHGVGNGVVVIFVDKAIEDGVTGSWRKSHLKFHINQCKLIKEKPKTKTFWVNLFRNSDRDGYEKIISGDYYATKSGALSSIFGGGKKRYIKTIELKIREDLL